MGEPAGRTRHCFVAGASARDAACRVGREDHLTRGQCSTTAVLTFDNADSERAAALREGLAELEAGYTYPEPEALKESLYVTAVTASNPGRRPCGASAGRGTCRAFAAGCCGLLLVLQPAWQIATFVLTPQGFWRLRLCSSDAVVSNGMTGCAKAARRCLLRPSLRGSTAARSQSRRVPHRRGSCHVVRRKCGCFVVACRSLGFGARFVGTVTRPLCDRYMWPLRSQGCPRQLSVLQRVRRRNADHADRRGRVRHQGGPSVT